MPPASTHIELRKGYVLVVMYGRLESLAQALREQREVARVCASRGDRRVLFDNRHTEAPAEDVRNAMFEWAGTFERSAILLQSEMGAVRANMWAVAHKLDVRAFASEEAAERWLLRA